MAESKSVAAVPLNGSNYPTWKIQSKMALMKDGLWGITSGTETAPPTDQADRYSKFVAKRDRALAIIEVSRVHPRVPRGLHAVVYRHVQTDHDL